MPENIDDRVAFEIPAVFSTEETNIKISGSALKYIVSKNKFLILIDLRN